MSSNYAALLAERMANESEPLAQRWLDRLAEVLPLDAYAISLARNYLTTFQI